MVYSAFGNSNVEILCDMLKIIANPARVSILKYLIENGSQCVSDISKALKINPNTTSHHLSTLRTRGIVLRHRYGKSTFFDIQKKEAIQRLVKSIVYANVEE